MGHTTLTSQTVQVVTLDEALTAFGDDMTNRGCVKTSVAGFKRTIRQIAGASGWTTIQHMNLQHANSFLAGRRRGDHVTEDNNCKPWQSAQHNAACSALRTFGAFCHKKMKWLPANPFEDLENNKRKTTKRRSRANTSEEAAKLILAAHELHEKAGGYAQGCPVVFLGAMYLTGLRHFEICNMPWRALDLHSEFPGIWTDPSWTKIPREDFVALPMQLVRWLRPYRKAVPDAPDDLVFPVATYKNSFLAARDAAGIEAIDYRGRPCTLRSTRKSYKTWLGMAGVPSQLVHYLCRHKEHQDDAYNDPPLKTLRKAVERLPVIMPEELSTWFRQKARKKTTGFDSRPSRCMLVTPDPAHTSTAHTRLASPGREAGEDLAETRSPGRGLRDRSVRVADGSSDIQLQKSGFKASNPREPNTLELNEELATDELVARALALLVLRRTAVPKQETDSGNAQHQDGTDERPAVPRG